MRSSLLMLWRALTTSIKSEMEPSRVCALPMHLFGKLLLKRTGGDFCLMILLVRGFFANVQTDTQPHPSKLSDCISTVMTGDMSAEEEVLSVPAND